MKKIFSLLLISFMFILGTDNVFALDISQVSLNVDDKSSTITVIDEGLGNLEVNPKLEFNVVGDFITYKLVLKNKDGKKYKVESVTDNNTNEHIKVGYDYNQNMNIDNKTILITLKYDKKITDSSTELKSINVLIKLIDEDDNTEDISINDGDNNSGNNNEEDNSGNNSVTGVQGKTDTIPKTSSPQTSDNVKAHIWWLFISLLGVLITITYLIRNKGKKYNKGILSILLLLTLVPTIVFASETKEIIFNINFENIKINIKHKVEFDTKGGNDIASQAVDNNEKAIKPTVPIKEHYNFIKWVDEETEEFDFNTPITKDIKLSAVWEKKSYTITYNSDGGSNVSSETKEYNETFTEPTKPIKNHYVFKKWVDENNDEYDFSTKATKNITLKALWEKETYTITFNSNSGSAVGSQTVKYQDKVTKPTDPTKDKHEFIKWLDEQGSEYNFNSEVTKNMILTAEWIELFTVTYDTDGGSTVPSETVRKNSKFTEPDEPIKDHYEFVNWYEDDMFTTLYNFNDEVTSDKLLYAKYTPKEYTITYNLDGGSVSTQNKNTYTIETETFTLINPEKDFFKFKGWTGTNCDEVEKTIVIPKGTTGDRIYNANWEGTTLVEHVQGLFEKGDPTLTDDNIDNSLRYIGRNVKNFVKFNNEPWVMYGVFDVDDGTGVIEKRVKLEKHGEAAYSAWSLKDPAVNNNNGINQWGESGDYPGSSMMRLLNTEFLDYTKTGNATWLDGSVYYYSNSLSKEAQDMIKDALWYTGAGNVADGIIYPQNSPMLTPEFVIQAEKSNYSGKMCSEGNMCNDDVVRTTRWVGKVGLPYASDFMYKTSGGSLGRDVCLKTATIYNWGPDYNECFQNTWNRWAFYISTMTPFADQSSASKMIGYTPTYNRLYSISVYSVDRALPNVYLKPEVKVIAGEGTSINPYILELE